jgi:DTW domain-containing protein YfiP
MLLGYCLCPEAQECKKEIQHIQSSVHVIMHHRERFLTTNTARLAKLCLPHCEIHLRGMINQEVPLEKILSEAKNPLLLYPSEKAEILTPEYIVKIPRPITLIVPDGSWRQASKVAKREKLLEKIPHVRVFKGSESQYKLRREPKFSGLATFEAIALALGGIEGFEIQQNLESVFLKMVERTLKSRGIKEILDS